MTRRSLGTHPARHAPPSTAYTRASAAGAAGPCRLRARDPAAQSPHTAIASAKRAGARAAASAAVRDMQRAAAVQRQAARLHRQYADSPRFMIVSLGDEATRGCLSYPTRAARQRSKGIKHHGLDDVVCVLQTRKAILDRLRAQRANRATVPEAGLSKSGPPVGADPPDGPNTTRLPHVGAASPLDSSSCSAGRHTGV